MGAESRQFESGHPDSYQFPNILIIFPLTLLLFSCISEKQPVEPLPNWAVKNYDNSLEIYGFGQALTSEEAKKKALQDISSKLIITITSQTKVQIVATNTASISDYRNDIQTKTQKLDIPSYQTVKKAYINNEYLILLKVNKKKIYDDYHQKKQEIFDKFTITYQHSKNATKFHQKQQNLNLIFAKEQKALQYLSILKALDKNFNYSDYLNQLKKYHQSYKDNLQSLNVIIQQSPSSKNIKNDLKEYLTKNFIMTSSQSQQNKDNIIINITASQTFQYIYNQYLCKINIKIESQNDLKQPIASTDIVLTGQSAISNQLAHQKALESLLSKFDEENLLQKLNLK